MRIRRYPALVVIGFVAGCATVQEGGGQTQLMKVTNTKISSVELRANTDTLATQVPAIFESGADEIIAKSTDPAVRRRAILWKTQTIPAFYQAFFRSDPLVSAFDGYTLSVQLQQSLETGPDQAAFGPEQPIALAAARNARTLIHDTLLASTKDTEVFQQAVVRADDWAYAHPIKGSIFTRPTMVATLAKQAGSGDSSVFEVVGSVDATLADLTNRLNVYMAFIPKQAQWQVELMSYEVAGRDEFRDALATLRSLHQFSDTANALMSPEGIRSTERTLLEQIDAERAAAFAYVTGERKAAFDSISEERRAVFGELDREKLEIMRQVEDLRGQVIGDVNRAIDRMIWRIAELFAAVLATSAVLAFLVLRFSRRGQAASAQSGPS